jgi:hypothetical protein
MGPQIRRPRLAPMSWGRFVVWRCQTKTARKFPPPPSIKSEAAKQVDYGRDRSEAARGRPAGRCKRFILPLSFAPEFPMVEKRTFSRHRVLKAGTIEFGGGAIDCMVRNPPVTGRALDVATPHWNPRSFHVDCRWIAPSLPYYLAQGKTGSGSRSIGRNVKGRLGWRLP